MNPLLETHLQTTDRKLSGVDKFRIFLPGSGNLVWTVIVTSLALMWAMGLPGAWVDYVRFSAESVATVHGRVIDSDDTNVEFNERTVSWATFKYEVDGVEHDGRAYGSEYYPSPGRRVSVGYLVDSPALARIAKLT
ncbi:MAG: hypothetical protein HOI95_19855, partial [Chromatiales bacterium]|nr:hypothetical protein [Chromatiales bacterium]